MSSNGQLAALACTFLALSGGVSQAQNCRQRDAWLMKNYRFAGPPKPGSIEPVDPVVAQLRQIQNTILSVMRKTNYGEDYEGTLFAAEQAIDTEQVIAAVQERSEAAAKAKAAEEEWNRQQPPPAYYIVLKDRTVEGAIVYWADRLMLHYITRQGAHVQVRRDLVDRIVPAGPNGMNRVEPGPPR